MIELIELMLYIDPQREEALTFCEACGGECYAPGFHCIRCERGPL